MIEAPEDGGGFDALAYWYTWQVTILGLGPIWMSGNEEVKRKTARFLEEGGIFAFGLSEKEHGADLYSSETTLYPQEDGTFLARGEKYYIGNGNEAALVSVFGKVADSHDYVFFVVGSYSGTKADVRGPASRSALRLPVRWSPWQNDVRNRTWTSYNATAPSP